MSIPGLPSISASTVAASLQARIPQLNIPQLPQIPLIGSIPGMPQVPNLSSILAGLFNNQDSGSEDGPSDAVDVVYIYDDSGNQMFDLARPIKANITRASKLMDHPVEGGSTITDFRVIVPVELELSMLCTSSEYASVYQQIKTAFLAGSTVSVRTKADVFLNMMIQAMPHDETPEMFDVLMVAVKLREVIFVTTQYQTLAPKDVQSANDQSTVKSGETSPKTTIAQNIANAAQSTVGSVVTTTIAKVKSYIPSFFNN